MRGCAHDADARDRRAAGAARCLCDELGVRPGGGAAGISFDGGDGLSCEGRVVIRGATGEQQGVAAEYAWLRGRYPGNKVTGQSLGECQQHPTDIMSIRTADGRDVEVHFDISDFFGKGL